MEDNIDIDVVEVCECGHPVESHSSFDDDDSLVFHNCQECDCEGFWN